MSLDKNLVVVLDVPSTALNSAVTVTAPDVAVVGVKSIYVPLVVFTVVTPVSTAAQTLSLLKNLPLVSVPFAALRSIVPTDTAPVAAVLTVVADIYVPLTFVKDSTPEPEPSISIHADPL